MARPITKWAGGKTQLLPKLKELMPKRYKRYYEPFVGGGALFFDLEPRRATINDVNKALITTYRAIRDDVRAVIKALQKFEYDKDMYDAARARNFQVGSYVEIAADFIFVNRTCFNGIFRTNQSGQFNVPFGRYENPTICDRARLRDASRALQGVKICGMDFSAVVETAKADDFVYFDPPYAPLSKTSNFVAFSKNGFGDQDQKRLHDVALELKRRGVHVLLSNSDAPIIRKLYKSKNWEIHEVKAARAINSESSRRGKITELIIR